MIKTLLFFLFLPCLSAAASFDCKKAVSLAEMTICNDKSLSRLDEELADIFRTAKEQAVDQKAFQRKAADAWKWREDHCYTKECLTEWFAQRKATLLQIVQEKPYNSRVLGESPEKQPSFKAKNKEKGLAELDTAIVSKLCNEKNECQYMRHLIAENKQFAEGLNAALGKENIYNSWVFEGVQSPILSMEVGRDRYYLMTSGKPHDALVCYYIIFDRTTSKVFGIYDPPAGDAIPFGKPSVSELRLAMLFNTPKSDLGRADRDYKMRLSTTVSLLPFSESSYLPSVPVASSKTKDSKFRAANAQEKVPPQYSALSDPELIEKLKSALLLALVDPNSVQFRDVKLNSSRSALCGQFNAKNRMGGYNGFKGFISTHSELMVQNANPNGFQEGMSAVNYNLAMLNNICN